MIDEVADALALEVGLAVVVERLLVLLSSHHRGLFSSNVPQVSLRTCFLYKREDRR